MQELTTYPNLSHNNSEQFSPNWLLQVLHKKLENVHEDLNLSTKYFNSFFALVAQPLNSSLLFTSNYPNITKENIQINLQFFAQIVNNNAKNKSLWTLQITAHIVRGLVYCLKLNNEVATVIKVCFFNMYFLIFKGFP